MAAIQMADPTYFLLRYEYLAEFSKDEHADVARHFGVTCIELQSDNGSFEDEQHARYYTESVHGSHGSFALKKMA